jgi:hypothetical protein
MKIFGLLILISIGFSCSDKVVELPGTYFMTLEGSGMIRIFCNNAKGGAIPPNILSYNYNNDYIIAAQKPLDHDEAIYERTFNYLNGRDKIYYWIIVVDKELCLGPLTISEYEVAKDKYSIPKSLELKEIRY